ncbi:MAG: hypothetical protein BWY36_00218 [Candidatus Diapherotrites archaeon ADurb.Bin253]|nr:MAG: hypothetical protein BWY36_00218 [Candidatus Diapherotrites archaeon ADurb.Bin253]
MGDKCEYDCKCANGYVSNGLGYCEPKHVCDSGDECWIISNGCQFDCTCENHDPDGLGGCNSGGANTFSRPGECTGKSTGTEVCEEGVQSITRILTSTWTWDEQNSFSEIPAWGGDGSKFVEERDSLGNIIYRYDPFGESSSCSGSTSQTIICPALVQLPFFGIYHVIIALILVALIYLTYHYLTKRKKVVSKNSRKSSKNKRK